MRDSENQKLKLKEPWQLVGDDKSSVEKELKKELSDKHILFGSEAVAVARCADRDDFLFYLPDCSHKYAVVHLTWSGSSELDERWPTTKVFADLEDWKVKCMVRDYFDFVDEINTFKVVQANKRVENQIALFGEYIDSLKPSVYLMDIMDFNIVFKVKGVEVLNYIDKGNNHINPWIIIESDMAQPEVFINREFYVIG